MSARQGAVGTLALVGGGEWHEGCAEFDGELLEVSGAKEVVVIPAAAAFERPDEVVARAVAYLEGLGAKVKPLPVLHRAEADDPKVVDSVRRARFVYLADGSPLHLRSVLKASLLWEAILAAYHAGGVLAASGAGATLVCDPMVDPRGGAYTVGLGVVGDLAVFPYHGTAATHLRERSIDLLPRTAKLVGIDEQTALIRDPAGHWRVAGRGSVSVYDGSSSIEHRSGAVIDDLP